MRVLVTGAGGYLGRHVVRALQARGHFVRALDVVRCNPAGAGVEAVAADLLASDLGPACDGVDAVVHLAARLQGDGPAVIAAAVEGTRRLVAAMGAARVGSLLLASSLSVYDWASAAELLDEGSSLERRPERRDAYTLAKLEQEAIARRGCARAGIALTILRPAILWGAGRELPPTVGQRLGPIHVVVAAARPLPAVHVENCADAFAAALEAGPRAEGTFNVVDAAGVTAERFLRDHLRRSGRGAVVVPATYGAVLLASRVLERCAPAGVRGRLPSFLGPARLAARYKPVRVDGGALRAAIGWRPPLSYEECLERTYAVGR